MGLFDFFKKQNKHPLPEMYKGIVSKDEYNDIIEIIIKYHNENGLTITKIDEGEIVVDVDGEEHHCYLDNLVRVLASNVKEGWEKIIYDHFVKIKPNFSALKYLYKDFDYASQFLRVLLKEDIFNLGDSVDNYVHRIDFPKTYTLLILEFEGKFHFIRRDEIGEWEKSESELFEIAIQNLPLDEIEAKEYEFGDKFTVFIFFSGDFSSSMMLDLKNQAEYCIGKYGTLLALPSKGTAFAHPIENGEILDLIEILNPHVQKFYNEDPGNVSTNFYWYYQNQIQIFPSEKTDNSMLIKLPLDLVHLLENSL